MHLGAVVVQYQAWPQVARTIEDLLAGTRCPDRILVVDNGSSDGSPAAIRESFPELDLIAAGHNGGAAAGMNIGAGRLLAEGVDALLLLTADCVVAPSAVELLEARLTAASAVGAVGPLLARTTMPGDVFSAGGFIDRRTWDPGHHRDPAMVAEWSGAPPRPCEWLDGACVMVRAAAFQRAGPLDERYFHYFDDVDHHLRLRSHGWTIECVPTAVAWQEPGPLRPELWVRNRLRFLARHAPWPVLVREVARQLRCGGRELWTHDRRRATARARGALRFLTGRWGPIPMGR